jgi:hypothetical protein
VRRARTSADPEGGAVEAPDGDPVAERRLRRVEVAGVVLAVAVGVALRFLTTSDMWLDEAQTVTVARLPLGDIPAALERDGLPPLFYFLLHWWMEVFGDGDLAVRALSGVLSVATLPFAYLAGRRLGGPKVGAFALVLFALNPFAIRYATEARMYALVMLLALVGFLLVDRALDAPTWPTLVGIAAVTALLLYSHYWSMWLLGAVGTVLALVAWRASDADRRRAARRIVVAVVAGGAAFLPWVPTFLEQAAHTATPWAPPARPTALLGYVLVDFGGGPLPEGLLLGTPVLAGLFVLGLFGVGRGGFRIELDLRTVGPAQGLAAVAALGLAYGAVAGLLGGAAFATRYASVVLPLFLLVAAVGVARFDHPLIRDGVLLGVGVLALLAAGHGIVSQRTQAGELADLIVAGDPQGGDLGPRPVVMYCPDQLGPAMHRVLPEGRFDQVVFPELELDTVDAPARVDWYDYRARQEAVPPADVARAVLDRAGDENAIWVVFSPTYRTPGERCNELVEALSATRPAEVLESADPADFFEHATLVLYRPVAR